MLQYFIEQKFGGAFLRAFLRAFLAFLKAFLAFLRLFSELFMISYLSIQYSKGMLHVHHFCRKAFGRLAGRPRKHTLESMRISAGALEGARRLLGIIVIV